MKNFKKIGIGVTIIAGAAGIAVIAENVKKRWFTNGFETGKIVGDLEIAENMIEKHSVLIRKYNTLADDYAELERKYDELCEEYE